MKIDDRERRALLRKDFAAFAQRGFYELNPEVECQDNWHIEAIVNVYKNVAPGSCVA